MGFHKLVNTAYFSEAARDWKKNGGKYTTAPQGSRDYKQYWEEQENRCKYGYKVGDLWISGRHYGYLNFFPMSRVPESVLMRALEEGKDRRGNISVKIAEKIVDFPSFWEVDYEWWNYKHIAWYGGEFMGVNAGAGGLHLGCLKARGAGFSYKEAWDGVYNYNFIPGSKSYYFAATEPFLIGDAIMDKVQTGLDWINQYCPYWKQNRQVKKTVMHQKASYLDEFGVERGKMSEIIGQIVDKPSKAHPYSSNIITPSGPKKWSDIQIGSKIFGSDGKIITVEATVELGEQDIYTMTFTDGRKVDCTLDHLWNISGWHTRQRNKELYTYLREETVDTKEIIRRLDQSWSGTNPLKIKLNGCTDYPESIVPVDPYTLGILLGDGSIKRATKNITPLTMLHEDVDQIKQYIPYEVKRCNWGTGIRNSIYISNGKKLFTDLKLIDKTAGTKFIPDIYKYNSKEVRLAIINGLLDTDGSVTEDFGVIEFCSKSEQLAKDFIWIVHSLGFGGTMKSRIINGTRYYRCYIYAANEELSLFRLPRKRIRIQNRKLNAKAVHITQYIGIQSVVFSHKELAKCIQVDAEDALYLIEDHIVTHNTRGKRGRKATFEEAGSFPGLEDALEVAMGSMRSGSAYVGQISVFGTGGEVGPGIQGLENIFGNPAAWDMLAFPNIWEDGMYNTECGYFVPCYRVNEFFKDADGNVDMKGAIIADDLERAKKKKSKRPKDLDRRKAEYPRTPAEALQRLNGNGFNLAELDAQIRRIESSKAIQAMIRHGKLIRGDDENKRPEFVIQPKDVAKPIEDFPHNQTDDLTGCVSVVERPFSEDPKQIPEGMYKLTFDAYYKEESEDVTSLWSVKIWKMDNQIDPSFANLPVAWYAGRPTRYEDNHEITMLLAEWYNAKIQGEISGGGQSMVTYAKQRRKLHMICNEPEMMHNKELASKSAGNSYLMNMPPNRKKLGMTYLEDWHVEPRGVDEKGNMILNVHRIYDIAFLREMRKHNPEKGNYDRISDAIIAMFEQKENYAVQVKTRRESRAFYSNERELFGGSGQSYSGETTSAY